MPSCLRRFAVVAVLAVAHSGCDGCGRRAAQRAVEGVEHDEPVEAPRDRACATAADCSDDDPCTAHECVDERCVVSLSPAGTPCDDETVCDGVSTCDVYGRCRAGAPPVLDDGDACTVDSCDPRRGVLHEPVPSDDGDACTRDSCDSATGQIVHTTLPVDDGNDCTIDSCDPARGVRHELPPGKYTCAASCERGFHVASRSRTAECGSARALRSYCAPVCGPSFHTCEVACPPGYVKRSETPGGTCGTNPSIMVFCMKG
jgi:hypothetical protein